PAVVGELLKWLRSLTHRYKTAIMLYHHPRKESQQFSPPPLTHDLSVIEWFIRVEGPRAWTNQTDVRVAIESGDENPVALRLKWNRRLQGDSPLLSLERHYDQETGEALGYSLLQGVTQLGNEGEALFNQLPDKFKFVEAKTILGVHQQKVSRLLDKWQKLRLLKKMPDGFYQKGCDSCD
ncbi:MAG: hypothetical protein ACRDF4_02915, partial [Rhabdochlamydiaceae bacterium]